MKATIENLDDKELGATLQRFIDANHPELTCALIVASGPGEESGIELITHIKNPMIVSTVLLHHAMMPGRHDQVLGFISELRHIINVAEQNIRYQIAIQKTNN